MDGQKRHSDPGGDAPVAWPAHPRRPDAALRRSDRRGGAHVIFLDGVAYASAGALPPLPRPSVRWPTAARWLAGYSALLLAFPFFARFFNDNYLAVVITLLLCIRPLGDRSLAPAGSDQADRLAA